jgi:energy-coupling factor transporter ATP-binding protein EcfA2
LIRIEELSHSYPVRARSGSTGSDGKKKTESALKDINLKVSKGERVVILGSSGSGGLFDVSARLP